MSVCGFQFGNDKQKTSFTFSQRKKRQLAPIYLYNFTSVQKQNRLRQVLWRLLPKKLQFQEKIQPPTACISQNLQPLACDIIIRVNLVNFLSKRYDLYNSVLSRSNNFYKKKQKKYISDWKRPTKDIAYIRSQKGRKRKPSLIYLYNFTSVRAQSDRSFSD